MTSLVGLHRAWIPKPVMWFGPQRRQPGEATSPEDVLAMLPQLKSMAMLIHCLQTERGITCGWIASAAQHPLFCDSIITCRTSTDAVLEATDGSRTTPPQTKQSLEVLRTAAKSPPSTDATTHAFMETFTGYDELIADVQAELLAGDFANSAATTILSAFSQLKDAVGVVRAFVSAALVMSEESLASLSDRMRGMLIVCLHRQRACTAAIRASAPRKLLNLVGAGFGTLPRTIILTHHPRPATDEHHSGAPSLTRLDRVDVRRATQRDGDGPEGSRVRSECLVGPLVADGGELVARFDEPHQQAALAAADPAA